MSVSILLLATATMAAAQDDSRWEHQSESQDVLLRDFVELWNDSEFDTGWVPSSSPLQVRFQIESTGGAGVEMEGVGHMGWPEGLTVAIDPVPDTGEIIVDAALEAVTLAQVEAVWQTWILDAEPIEVMLKKGKAGEVEADAVADADTNANANNTTDGGAR